VMSKVVEEIKKEIREQFGGDDPTTINECPVCLGGVELAEVAQHLRAHRVEKKKFRQCYG